MTCEALSTAELFEVALDAAGMGSWELYLSTGAIHRTLRHDQIFGLHRDPAVLGLADDR